MLIIDSVSIGYADKQVVKNVSFTVSQGEFCALLGLNGSGKTTLLKGICGLLPISDGRCFFDKIDLTKLGEKNRAKYVSLIPQRHSKLIGVTVMDAVLMGLNAKLGFLEFPSHQDKDSARNALEKMGVSHLANEDFSKLSEGQKQLVILARTLVQDAPIMLMDEPDSALDFPNKYMILSEARGRGCEAGGRGCCFTFVNTEVKQHPRPPASLVT
ncbi:MAG: ABC transporter ATP-binding protein, partial [Oscillospiraceae bacterium]|nr:ABC transporter ATP-binding protein [Oscillospiraceae bacterium]